MGSKRKLSEDILKYITSRHYGITDFYDLFGGGGAISFQAVKSYRFNVHYNELNSHITKLVEYLKNNKVLGPEFYKWYSRDEFFKAIESDDPTYLTGFIMTCWSFGNKQSSYLYGKDIEDIKRMAHEFIVNGDKKIIDFLKIDINFKEILKYNDIQKRRNLFCSFIRNETGKRFDMQNLENLNRFEYLERLQNLQNLQNIQNLKITNSSYEQVDILGKNPVIYCDIPYKGTGEYKEGGFDHEKFYKWVDDCDFPVYISEYDAPFQECEMFSHISTLSATNNKKKVVERLFWNGKGDVFNHKLF